MSKNILVVAAGVGVLVVIMLFVKNRESNIRKSVAQMVAEKGTPTLLVQRLEVNKTDLRVLKVLVLPQDPQTVTDWSSITNLTLVWAESESGKRNARYFYDEMKNDKSFDGGAWYSSRSLFNGEEVMIVKIDAYGNASDQKTFRVDAFSMRLMGFVPHKSSADEQK